MAEPLVSPLHLSAALLAAWGLIAVAGLLRPRSLAFAGRALFVTGAVCGALLAAVALASLGAPAEQMVLPVGLPDLPMHLRLDGLSAWFLLLLGAASAGVSLFSAGYFRPGEGTLPGVMGLQYHLFLASMGLVILADDAYTFMVAWESMAVTSYFLVTTQHRIAEIRRAGFTYLLMAHVGAISILLAFGVLQGGSWQFTFDAMRAADLPAGRAALAFMLALVGFGAKAGIVPLHVWLPEAHPAAPSPVSALMSGVMLKTAVYGLLRVTFDLLGDPSWWWGLPPLALGLFTALFGAVFAAVQTDMKRLLAYSSVENIGVLFIALGLTIVFAASGMKAVAALAMAALLYHALNHGFMKSLLFLGTGSVLHATGERNLGRLGGLIHRMPWVAWLTLIGAMAIAALPPLNGFVSEWLLLQSFLFTPQVPHPFLNMLLPMCAALFVLAAALAGYVMVKFFGIVFLGQAREPTLADAHDAGTLERAGMLWLALGCVALGLLPGVVVPLLGRIATELSLGGIPTAGSSLWLLAPLTGRQASYSALLFLLAIGTVVALTALAVRAAYHRRVRFGPPWDCGFGGLDARMQDTAEGFGQPIRFLFQPLFRIERELPAPDDARPHYRIEVQDRTWALLYRPLQRLVQGVADRAAMLQQGRIAVYLTYSLLTLILMLALVL